jgi:tRNA pseudouridine55 synthase
MSLFGLININKPKGCTSHDVISRLRKILNIKQIGHTGTLDPMATGVLPIAVGKATKIIQYIDSDKAYRAFIKLGIKTDTYDLEGTVLEENPVAFDLKQVESILNQFKGNITQQPPMHSAVHYKGKRLYEYARANIEVNDIPERQVNISSINLIEVLEENSKNPIIVVDIDCSSGTYIRSIANDLGKKLTYGAVLIDLIRTKACKLHLDTSYTLEEIEIRKKNDTLKDIIINPICILDLKCCKIEQYHLERIQKGQHIEIDNFFEDEKIQLIYENKLAAIAKVKEKKIFPTNVFV